MRKVEGSFFYKPRKCLRNCKAAQPNVKDSGMFGKIEISVLTTYFYPWHQWDITFVYISASNRWCEASPDVAVGFFGRKGVYLSQHSLHLSGYKEFQGLFYIILLSMLLKKINEKGQTYQLSGLYLPNLISSRRMRAIYGVWIEDRNGSTPQSTLDQEKEFDWIELKWIQLTLD